MALSRFWLEFFNNSMRQKTPQVEPSQIRGDPNSVVCDLILAYGQSVIFLEDAFPGYSRLIQDLARP